MIDRPLSLRLLPICRKMKPISQRPIFALSLITSSNQKIINNSQQYVAYFSTQSPFHRRHEEDSRSVRVSVWWDFENCNLPSNINVFRVSQSITNAIRANGIKGPIQITAFGDVAQISRTNQEALSSTGINLTHVPSGRKNSADRSLLVDLMHWVSQNPPPAHLFLISGDRDFACILHRLRMNNYNILLASPDSAPSVLCSAATIMWQWNSLLKGENLTGKLFNQPPDGPYNSWYGHYKAPLEDPYYSVITEQSSCVESPSSSEVVPQDSNPRPIPKTVMKQISQILSSYPEGVSITQLRADLSNIDREFYGYKKFSRFLLAMPDILKLHSSNDGQFRVQGINRKAFEESVAPKCVKAVSCKRESEVNRFVHKNNGERKSSCEDVAEKTSVLLQVEEPKVKAQSTILPEENQNESSLLMIIQEVKVRGNAEKVQDPKKEENQEASAPIRNTDDTQEHETELKLQEQPEKIEVASPFVDEIKDLSRNNENQILVPDNRNSGMLERIRMMWFGSEGTSYSNAEKVQDPKKEENQEESAPIRNTEDTQEHEAELKLWEQPEKIEVDSPLVDEIKDLSRNNENQILVPDIRNSGMFERIRMMWFGNEGTSYGDENCLKYNEALSGATDKTRQDTSLFSKFMNMLKFWSLPEVADKVGKNGEGADRAKVFDPKQVDDKVGKNVEGTDPVKVDLKQLNDKAEKNAETVYQVKVNNPKQLDEKVGKKGETADQVKVLNNLKFEFFSKESFWKELETFLDTSQGLASFSRSRNREHLARILQKQGPLILRSLSETDLLHLVDLLVSDQKWVEETNSQISPFKLTHHATKNRCNNNHPSTSSNGLSLIFAAKHPTASQEFRETKCPNPTHTGVPQLYRCSSNKPTNELLADCQKVVDRIVKEHPEGFNMGSFRSLFLEENRYPLDLQKLGYEKLLNLLHTMSGIRIEYNMIFPAESGESSYSSWDDELGPMEGEKGKMVKTDKEALPDYEPLEEDDIFSNDESEEEDTPTNCETGLKQDSVLLEILDSWYPKGDTVKEKASMRGTIEAADGTTASQTDSLTKNEMNPVRKRKSCKDYKFVTEEPVEMKDKLVSGIMDCMKSSGEKSNDSRVLN